MQDPSGCGNGPPPGQFSQFIWQVLAETGVPSLGQISNSNISGQQEQHTILLRGYIKMSYEWVMNHKAVI